jgi:hypothetical protein
MIFSKIYVQFRIRIRIHNLELRIRIHNTVLPSFLSNEPGTVLTSYGRAKRDIIPMYIFFQLAAFEWA